MPSAPRHNAARIDSSALDQRHPASVPGLSSLHNGVNAWSWSSLPASGDPDELVSTPVNEVHRPVGRQDPTTAVTVDGYPRDSTLRPPPVPFATRPVSSSIPTPSAFTNQHAQEQGVDGFGEFLHLTDGGVCTERTPPQNAVKISRPRRKAWMCSVLSLR